MGYDVHRLTEGRKLIIGGVDIPYEKGLLGHSDADVLLHAIMDALLGAAALGDIGKHFPDSDEKYKGISSVDLLSHVGGMIEKEGYAISNIDEMRKIIADTLNIDVSCVNIKATTEEGLGFTGSGEGISSQAVCLLESVYDYSQLSAVYGSAGCSGCSGCKA